MIAVTLPPGIPTKSSSPAVACRGKGSLAAPSDPWRWSGGEARRPPIPAAEPSHEGGDDEGAGDEGVDEDAGGDGEAELHEVLEGQQHERGEGVGEDEAGGGDDGAGARERVAGRLSEGGATAFLADAGHEVDVVVDAEGVEEDEEEEGDALPGLTAFIVKFADRRGWDPAMKDRLTAVAEETLLTLAPLDLEAPNGDAAAGDERRLIVLASSEGPVADLEFIGGGDDANLEDRLRQPQQHDSEAPVEHEISLRLLRNYASSVRHQQYHDTDIITVRVDPPGAS